MSQNEQKSANGTPQSTFSSTQLQDGIAATVMAALSSSPLGSLNSPIVGAVSVKLPSFDPDDAKLWFAAIEEEFKIKGISVHSTMYSHALSAIDASTRRLIGDIMLMPFSSNINKYELLKTRLISSFGSTQEQRIKKILDLPPIDPLERPSLWLARVRSIAGSEVSFDGPWPFVILLRKLPTAVRELASVKGLTTIQPVIDSADDLWKASQLGSSQVCEVRLGNRPHIDGICPYHQEHGFKAWTCLSPCKLSRHVQTSRLSNKATGLLAQHNSGQFQRGWKQKKKDKNGVGRVNTFSPNLEKSHATENDGQISGADQAGFQ